MALHYFSAGYISFENGIMHVVYQKEDIISLEDMKEITRIREEVMGETPYCSLIDLRKDFLHMSKEAKNYAAENPTILQLRKAEVLLVNDYAKYLGVKTYANLFRRNDNVKVMMDEEKAVKWLRSELEK